MYPIDTKYKIQESEEERKMRNQERQLSSVNVNSREQLFIGIAQQYLLLSFLFLF